MPEVFAGFSRTDILGVPVLWKHDSRFKSFRLHLASRRALDQRAAARALLPGLLMQGTAQHRDRPALARRMEELYGASVNPVSGKVGETHVLRFAVDCVAGEFLPGRPDQLADGLDLLTELLARPMLEDGGFPAVVFERERRQAVHDARAVADDRAAWAAQQAMALACVGEPMAIPEHGGVPAIEALDRFAPEQARQDFLSRGELLVVGMGALPEDAAFLAQVRTFLGSFLDAVHARQPEPVPPAVQRTVTERRSAVERVDLQQSKLVLLFRVPWTDDPKTWMARALGVSMLGGGPHSRLFREVREKRSLAYYAQAGLDRHKGLLLVHVGLDEAAAGAVEAETLGQLAQLANGAFTGDELDTARAGILSTITALTDGIRSHMQFVEDQWNLGLDRTPEDLFRSYLEIDAAQVADSLSGIQLDFSYLLAPSAAPAGVEVQA
ncbi:MAG: insulinase family protein [Planctomycetes bacterium]|nr:insulinase family protein [Planctomycetota bacterium]